MPSSARKPKIGVLAHRGTKDDPGVPALVANDISAVSMDRPGKDVTFSGIPGPIWDRLPGVVKGRLEDGSRWKTLVRGDRKVTFFSEPEKVRR